MGVMHSYADGAWIFLVLAALTVSVGQPMISPSSIYLHMLFRFKRMTHDARRKIHEFRYNLLKFNLRV